MSIRQQGDRRVLELEFEVPGTPEQVWQAIATGPGISAWFTPCTLDEREGGAIAFSFGIGVESSGRVVTWQKPTLFAYEEPGWVEGMPPLASEFHIETRTGGGCTVRLVHSLFASDASWDDQFDGMANGWPPFFRVLAVYLREHAGQRCAPLSLAGHHPEVPQQAWTNLLRALAVPEQAQVGDTWQAPDSAPHLKGTIEHLRSQADQGHLMVHLNAPAPGVALFSAFPWQGRSRISVQLYFYGDEPTALRDEQQGLWHAWLRKHYPDPGS